MVIETAVKVATEVTKHALKESAKSLGNEVKKKALEKGTESIFEKTNLQFNPTIDYANPPSHMKAYKMFKELDIVKENPDTQMAFFNKMISDSNFVGQNGELIAYDIAKNTFGGEIQNQVGVGSRRLDMFLPDTKYNAKIKTLIIKDGYITFENSYIPRNKSVALEIKNGAVKYVRNEINNNHALDQILQGKSIADHSLLCIRQDVAQTIIDKQIMLKELQKVQESGGKIAIFLPSETVQNSMLMEAI